MVMFCNLPKLYNAKTSTKLSRAGERERQADRSTDKACHDALLHLNVVSGAEIEVTEHPESYT